MSIAIVIFIAAIAVMAGLGFWLEQKNGPSKPGPTSRNSLNNNPYWPGNPNGLYQNGGFFSYQHRHRNDRH